LVNNGQASVAEEIGFNHGWHGWALTRLHG